MAKVLYIGIGASPLAEKCPCARAAILPVARRCRETRESRRQALCMSCAYLYGTVVRDVLYHYQPRRVHVKKMFSATFPDTFSPPRVGVWRVPQPDRFRPDGYEHPD